MIVYSVNERNVCFYYNIVVISLWNRGIKDYVLEMLGFFIFFELGVRGEVVRLMVII